MKYADLLNDYINRSKLSLTEIAEKCEREGVKITVSYLSKLRNEKMPPPSFKVSATLAKVLNQSPEKLLAAGMNEIKENDIIGLEEALSFVYPNFEYGQIYERARYIVHDPKIIMEHDISYSADVSEEDFLKMLEEQEQQIEEESNSVLSVPVLGSIPAGEPNFLQSEYIEEWINIPNLWNAKDGELFVLKVQGDSMEGSRIYEGDRVIVKIQPEVESGEIAVVNVNGDSATLKRVKHINDQVVLYPDNPKYEPIIIQSEKARIIGKVIQVMFEPKRN